MRKVAECNSKSFESDIDEINEKELCGFFEADNTLCHLNDRWVKIEAVMDSGAAESVAPADMAPPDVRIFRFEARSDIHECMWRETLQPRAKAAKGEDQRGQTRCGHVPVC